MKTILVSSILLFVVCSNFTIKGQSQLDSMGFTLQLSVIPSARKSFDKSYIKKVKELKRKNRKEKSGLSIEIIQIGAKEIITDECEFGKFYQSLTPESQIKYKSFFNAVNPLHVEFEDFYKQFKDSTIFQIRRYYISVCDTNKYFNIHGIPDKTERRNSFDSVNLYQLSSESIPKLDGIDGSKLIVSQYYGRERRDAVSTSDQSIYLRGSYKDESPFYPDYNNIYCDACCGPAAGQSILEWYNVPVKNNHNVTLTTPWNIQQQLADEMQTEEGTDYTHFNDLANTLYKDKYRNGEGMCFRRGSGTMTDIMYMLSEGAPVILLLAWDCTMHYVTVYGYDRTDDEFIIANKINKMANHISYNRLMKYFYWSDFSDICHIGIKAIGMYSKSLLSYCPTGCSKQWAYNIPHNVIDFFVVGWPEVYFRDFNRTYTTSNERTIKANFVGIPGIGVTDAGYIGTQVSNHQYYLPLFPTNNHVITYPNHLGVHILRNNSINRSPDIYCRVDLNFIESQRYIECKWIVRNQSNQIIEEIPATKTLNSDYTDPENWGYTFDFLYTKDMRYIEFSIHGGWRSVKWELLPCDNDLDHDDICDEFDPDMDNDGIENNADNCVKVFNPEQIDYNDDGQGYACDQFERCIVNYCGIEDVINKVNCPASFFCRNPDWDLMAPDEFFDGLMVIMKKSFIKRIKFNPEDPNEVIRGRFAMFLLKRRIDSLVKEYSVCLDRQLRDTIIKDLLNQYSLQKSK